MSGFRILTLFFFSMAMGSAAAKTTNVAERFALVEKHAGAPVPSVFFPSEQSWEPLGGDKLLLWSSSNRAFLIKVDGFCNNLSFSFAISVRHHSPKLSTGFDRIVVRDRGSMRDEECRILEIRPVDVKAMKAEQRAVREAAKKP